MPPYGGYGLQEGVPRRGPYGQKGSRGGWYRKGGTPNVKPFEVLDSSFDRLAIDPQIVLRGFGRYGHNDPF